MNSLETRATLSIASLFSLRMLGLFMILPIFTPLAQSLSGATPFLIGVALGIYGLTQACFQFPFGTLSDRFPRKTIISIGFIIFTLGSFLAAFSHSIDGVIMGRALQGAGAVGSTLTALLTDLVRPEKRAKAMAILGMMIGFSFFLSMILGPYLAQHFHLQGIFLLTALLGLLAIVTLFTFVPNAPQALRNKRYSLKPLLKNYQILSLDIGIFFLHFILTATFIVIPTWITNWHHYLLPLMISIVLTFAFIGLAEKTKKVFMLYYVAIAMLILAEILLWKFHWGLTLFFLSFNLLEANIPSLISRLAPPEIKGGAIGIYSTCQFLGIFCGGLVGGIITSYFPPQMVLLSCAIVAFLWLGATLIIVQLRRSTWQEV